MSRTMRHKHVMREMLDDNYDLPKENQQIVRVVSNRGNNLLEVESSIINVENFLVSMPNKFRKNLWVKRGDYLIVDPIEEGDKVKAEIIRILTAEHIKEFTKQHIWPKKFTKKRELPEDDDDGVNEDYNSEFPIHNINRKRFEADDNKNEDDTSDEDDDNDAKNEQNGKE